MPDTAQETTSRFRLAVLACAVVALQGCNTKHSPPPQDASLRSVVPNEAQRAAREANRQKRQIVHRKNSSEKADELVVLAGALNDDGVGLTKEEWNTVYSIEALYIDSWNQATAAISKILTEEQIAIRRKIRSENSERELTGSEPWQILEASTAYTAEQLKRRKTLRRIRDDICREAVAVLVGLIRPGLLNPDVLGKSATHEMVSGLQLTDAQKRGIWHTDACAQYSLEHISNLRPQFSAADKNRLSASVRIGATAACREILTNQQLTLLSKNTDKNAGEKYSASSPPELLSVISQIVADIDLSTRQLTGVSLIEQQMTEALSEAPKASQVG